MATLAQKVECDQRMRKLLKEGGLPEPDAVEYGYACVRFFFAKSRTCLVVDIDDPGAEANSPGAEANSPGAEANSPGAEANSLAEEPDNLDEDAPAEDDGELAAREESSPMQEVLEVFGDPISGLISPN